MHSECNRSSAAHSEFQTKLLEDLSELLHRTRVDFSNRSHTILHRAGEGGIAVFQVSWEGLDEDGKENGVW